MISDILSLGNTKLPKTTEIFNLLRMVTCPGATDLCKQKCYAVKAERQYSIVRLHRGDMYQLSGTDAFAWLLETALSRLPATVTAVRIHESGDFYSQRYIDIWLDVIRNFPKLPFYAYTKSYMFDFRKRPDNFGLKLSLDSTSKPEAYSAMNTFDGVSWMQQRGEPLPDWLQKAGYLVCPGSCKECTYCLSGKGNLVFPEH
jgi:hypothetical protein